jgi:Cyclic nucleotide-binding domain
VPRTCRSPKNSPRGLTRTRIQALFLRKIRPAESGARSGQGGLCVCGFTYPSCSQAPEAPFHDEGIKCSTRCDFNHGLARPSVPKFTRSFGVAMSKTTLPLKIRRELQAIARPVLKDKGAVLFRLGQPCRGAFLVRSGQLRLTLDAGYPARTVGSGFIVGLPATFSDEPYSLTAQTTSRCRLDFISRQKLLTLLHRNPDAGFQILRLLSEEIFKIRKVVKNGGGRSRYSPAAA